MQEKRRRAAWLLLLAFVPMLVLASLHVHRSETLRPADCAECVHHVPHAGHFSTPTDQLDACVLCQFMSLPYVASASQAEPLPAADGFSPLGQRPCHPLAVVCGIHAPRAPPTV